MRNKGPEGSKATVSRDEDRMLCPSSGKVSYPSRKKALKALASYLKSSNKYGDQSKKSAGNLKTALRCESCGQWHWATR